MKVINYVINVLGEGGRFPGIKMRDVQITG